MNITGIFISFGIGYLGAWSLRALMGHFSARKEFCNLRHSGIRWRFILAILFIIIGWYTESEIWLILSGFTFYESRSKWCIVESIKK